MTLLNKTKYSRFKYNFLSSMLTKALLAPGIKDLESVIFTATAGRTGSATLTQMFKCVPKCTTLHEPYPAMHGRAMIEKNNGDDSFARFEYKNIKAINIRREAQGARYYMESNHMFLKSFIEYAIEDFGDRLKVIHLTRNAESVANSIVQIGNIPGTSEGNWWWLDYHGKNNVIKITHVLDQNKDFDSPFYKALWYYYEMEARADYWRNQVGTTDFIDVDVSDFKDIEKMAGLMNLLGVKFDEERLSEYIGSHLNKKISVKQQEKLGTQITKKMHKNFQKLLDSEGIPLPSSIACVD